MKAKLLFLWFVGVLAFVLLAAIGRAETISWSNPTTGIDNTGATVPLSAAEQAALTNYLRYKVGTGAWTYFGETRDGKTSWVGTPPAAVGVAADYTVSAALRGSDGVEKDSWSMGEALHPSTRYTVPFPPGPTPGSPTGPTISRP